MEPAAQAMILVNLCALDPLHRPVKGVGICGRAVGEDKHQGPPVPLLGLSGLVDLVLHTVHQHLQRAAQGSGAAGAELRLFKLHQLGEGHGLPGVAVKSVKIDGVLHEFSTIPGVKEDVTEIVLNIKGLVAKLHCDEAKTVEISAEGPCEVTAAAIKGDSEVEVLNPELHIGHPGRRGKALYGADPG